MGLLTSQDRKVLAAIHLDSRASVLVIAKRTKLRHHTVRYSMQKLRDAGVILPFVMVNPHALGLSDFCIFFRTEHAEPRAREKIFKVLTSIRNVAYVAELSGQYQWTISLFARNIFAVEEFLDTLALSLPKTGLSLTVAMRSEWTLFRQNFGADQPSGPNLLRRTEATESVLDSVDVGILNALSSNPDTSLLKIAKALRLSEGTVRRRLGILEDKNIIVGMPYEVDASKIQMLSFRALIHLKNKSRTSVERLYAFAHAHPSVSAFVRCLGAWDIEINFEVVVPSDAGEFVQEIYDQFSDSVYTVETLHVLGVYKCHRYQHRPS